MKWLASGPSMKITLEWKTRIVKTGPEALVAVQQDRQRLLANRPARRRSTFFSPGGKGSVAARSRRRSWYMRAIGLVMTGGGGVSGTVDGL